MDGEFIGWALIVLFAVGLLWQLRPRGADKVTAAPWSAPLGVRFEHCGTICVVIDDGQWDGGWCPGVLCHYRDDAGRIRELFFTPAQWDKIGPAPAKVPE